MFYSNNLANTLLLRSHNSDEHTTRFVHDLEPLQLRLKNYFVTRTQLHVPAVIVTYNLFMKGVEHFDQVQSTSVTVQK